VTDDRSSRLPVPGSRFWFRRWRCLRSRGRAEDAATDLAQSRHDRGSPRAMKKGGLVVATATPTRCCGRARIF
jgi:hypothetical protein